jgi:hypothetical protein
MFGVEGTDAAVSMVMVSPDEAALTLPAVSAVFAVTVWLPSVSMAAVTLQLPPTSAAAVPSTVVPSVSYSVTVPYASAVPVKVGVVSFVILSVPDNPVSEPVVISGAEGADGADKSKMMLSPADAELVLPAASVAFTVTVCAPVPSTDAVMLQLPLPSAAAMPSTVVPSVSYSVTALPASVVPVKIGVVSFVILSVLEVPVSEPAVISGAAGADGADISIVMLSSADAVLMLPAASVAFTVTVWTPAVSADAVMFQLPPPAVAVPSTVVPSVSYSVTVLPVSAVPVKVGVVSFVRLSVDDEPVSEPAVISGAEGADGAVVSITMLLFAPSEPAAPGAGRVSIASMPPVMCPPFRDRALMLS